MAPEGGKSVVSLGVMELLSGRVERLGAADGQFWVLFAGAASVLLNAIVSPVLGAMSDRTGRRNRREADRLRCEANRK